MSQLRQAHSHVCYSSDSGSRRSRTHLAPFSDIPECREQEQEEARAGSSNATGAAGSQCHSPSYRSHDSGFSDSSDGGADERRLVSRVHIGCQPGEHQVGPTEHQAEPTEHQAEPTEHQAEPTEHQRHTELTRRAGRRLCSQVGADVAPSPLLGRWQHVRTIRVDSDAAGAVSVSVSVSELPLRRRWSFADTRDAGEEAEEDGHSATVLTSCSLPRRHTVAGCRLQLRAAAVRSRSVRQWLQDLATLCEPECSTTLQSKTLVSDATRLIQLMTDDVSNSLRSIQLAGKAVSQAFAALCRQLETVPPAELRPQVEQLVERAGRLCAVCRAPPVALRCRSLRPVLTTDVPAAHAALAAAARRLLTASCAPHLVSAVTALGGAITRLVDQLLTQQLRLLTEALRPPHVLSCGRAALAATTAAGAQGCHVSGLFCRLGGISQVLRLATDRRFWPLRLHVLRALSALCCAETCVRTMEQEGGVDLVCGLLCDDTAAPAVRHEAAAVLAQMTAPWLSANHTVRGLSRHLPAVVQTLTDMVEESADDEALLLAAAGLANLTCIEPDVLLHMTARCTVETLTSAAQRVPGNVFVLDQVATVLANVASGGGDGLLRRVALPALVRYLQLSTEQPWPAAATAACHRLQQNTAVALSRMCADRRTARHLTASGAAARLERLCRHPQLRGRDDRVLVACLTALRKIMSFCPDNSDDGESRATDLVRPKLLEVFMRLSCGDRDVDERER